MSKYKPGDKFESEVTGETGIARDYYYVTTVGIVNKEALDRLKKIEPEEPEVDWSKVEVDTPILAKNLPEEAWSRRHFAKYEKGKVYAWNGGTTSWSAIMKDDVFEWEHAKLAEVDND